MPKNILSRFAIVFLLLCTSTSAQVCIYNDTMCTCTFGSTDGDCYEQTDTDGEGGLLCSKRTCNAGWTCDCEGDYYCNQKDIDVYKLVNFDDYTLITDVPCQVETQKTISSSGFQLGYFHPQFSDTGLLDQECQNFVWWLDGELKNIFNTTTPVTNDNLAEVKTTLSDWNQLPIYSGSVIAYRWKDAAYSCYNSISLLSINGTETDTTNSALVTHHFSNDFEDDWFGTEFVEGSTWKEHIASSTEDNYGSENTDITNTYWRIKIL